MFVSLLIFSLISSPHLIQRIKNMAPNAVDGGAAGDSGYTLGKVFGVSGAFDFFFVKLN